MPGAERHDIGDHAPTDGGPAKAIPHITWDRNATAATPADWVSFDTLLAYFTGVGKGVAPHILWDPFTGRVAQLVPADSRSKSLADQAGGTRTNRAGSVVLQIEAVFFPYCRRDGRVYARLVDAPCAGWDRLHAWVKSWGVPDVWPMGRPVDFTSHRDERTWETQAGWYGHSQVPENDHQDPGSWPAFGGAVGVPTNSTPLEEDFMTDAQYRDVMSGLGQLRDMIAGAPEQFWQHPLENAGRLDAAGHPYLQPARDFQVDQDRKFALTLQALTAIQARQAAQDAVLATVLSGVHGLDGDAIVARINTAVDTAVHASLKDGVTLQVAVTGTTTPKGN
jgi:hypothetical protein